MPQGNPVQGELYRHFKNKLYQIVAIADHSETGEEYVVYQALYGDYKTYIRPFDMFISPVDREKYPEVEQKYRFEHILRESLVNKKAPKTETFGTENQNIQDKISENMTEEKPQTDASAETEVINPWLDKFLDADSFSEKYKVICDMADGVTDKLIDDIAVIADVVVADGNLFERYEQLKYCIRTKGRYENEHLR